MKGYHTSSGYMGYVRGKWMMFPTDREYAEYMEELDARFSTSKHFKEEI